MGFLTNMALLAVCVCIVQVYGYDQEDYRRALKAFHLQRSAPEQKDMESRGLSLPKCKEKEEECFGIPKCCGNLQCAWVEGFKLKKGLCVECVNEHQMCQRNAQCCAGLQCDKGKWPGINGVCQAQRDEGDCYQDDQCKTDCKKKWWALTGLCE